MNARKGLLIIFLSVTLVVTILFSYTMYLFIGVKGMLLKVEDYVTIEGVAVDIDNDNAVVSVNISVNNPSEFSFISYIALKRIQVGQEYAELAYGSSQYSGTFVSDTEFPAYSNRTLQFKFNWPGANVSALQKYLTSDENWLFYIRMLIKTVINKNTPIRVDFLKFYHK